MRIDNDFLSFLNVDLSTREVEICTNERSLIESDGFGY